MVRADERLKKEFPLITFAGFLVLPKPCANAGEAQSVGRLSPKTQALKQAASPLDPPRIGLSYGGTRAPCDLFAAPRLLASHPAVPRRRERTERDLRASRDASAQATGAG